MGRPLRIEFAGAYYHVTSRGNERKDIFVSQKDREQFLSYLESAVFRYKAVIHVYCLMSNHYHLLLETPAGNLSQVMQHINGAYTNYFNVKRKRSGHLFQGRYKAILIDADEYAKELSRYIHLNPVRAKMVSRAEAYRWSSYLDYIGERKSPEWLKTSFILDYFGKGKSANKNYQTFVEDLTNREYESPLNGATAATILGGTEFVSEITAQHIDGKQLDRDVPAIRKLTARPTLLDAIIETTGNLTGNNRLSEKSGIIYLCHKYSGARLKEIGKRFGIGESAVSQASRRFMQEMERDKELRELVEQMVGKLGLSIV
jgi:REP element-mobilizing transposase RayT